jgi:hypothetical protein
MLTPRLLHLVPEPFRQACSGRRRVGNEIASQRTDSSLGGCKESTNAAKLLSEISGCFPCSLEQAFPGRLGLRSRQRCDLLRSRIVWHIKGALALNFDLHSFTSTNLPLGSRLNFRAFVPSTAPIPTGAPP